jgi:phycobilisome core-membrane linker protein
VTKSVEYIHRRLLGRPTYGRQEINAYFDICAKKGFYALVDAILDSQEYSEVFGEDTVPYERYVTPAGLSLRGNRVGSIADKGSKVVREETPRFVELAAAAELRTEPDIQFRVNQGVSKKREQTKVFKLTSLADKSNLKLVIGAAYRQVFERDIAPYIVQNEFSGLESKLGNGEINLKEFIEGLGTSNLYLKEFYTPYPNTKVIELGTKHFLGRAPLDQAEIRKYNQILATKGLKGFISAIVGSMEYSQAFGEDVVPYNRYLTLPAANFPNTQKLYNTLTKQNKDLVVPSFETVKSRMDGSKMPLMGKAIADIAAQTRQQEQAKAALVELGRSSTHALAHNALTQSVDSTADTANCKPARIYRMNPGMGWAETELLLNAIYSQIISVDGEQVPDQFRQADLDHKFHSGDICVREFVKTLASSEMYRRRFYLPYPEAKVIEFLFRHLLGRAPATQAEIHQYLELLVNQGLAATVTAMVESSEYLRYFGDDVVPYQRHPNLPIGNYLGNVKAEVV